jgi:lactate racemase
VPRLIEPMSRVQSPSGPSELKWGTRSLPVIAPPGWTVDIVQETPLPAWSKDRVAETLAESRLPELARGARSISILIPDGTRVARSDLFLPALMDALVAAGVQRKAVRVVLATGTHAAAEERDRRALLGDLDVEVVQHDARDPRRLTEVGVTREGNRVSLSKEVLGSDLVILTGRVTNHYFAGMTGGPKVILPGVAGHATVVANHRKVLDADGRPHPRAKNGVLEGNPVHEEMVAAAQMLPMPSFLVNSLVDSQRQLVGLHAGEWAAAHALACAQADARGRVPVAAPYDVVMVSCGGFPYDRSLMQALKAVVDWSGAVRDGGVLLWVAGCGMAGLEGFRRWFACASREELRLSALSSYDLFAHNTILVREVLERVRVVLVASAEIEDDAQRFGLHPVRELPRGIEDALRHAGPRARCLLVPEGNATWAAA